LQIELLIILFYFLTLPIISFIARRKLTGAEDYFLGSRNVKWYAVTFSIVAAETSTLTFISLPGISYLHDLTFLQVVLGYIIGRVIVAYLFLPKFYEGKLTTSYHFLEKRFGKKMRKTASIVFLFTRIAADGVRLFATAIPLKFLLDINYFYAIIIIALIALAYSLLGGMRSVIWVDVWQMIVYIGGAIIAGIFILNVLSPHGLSKVIEIASENSKLRFINLGFNYSFAEFIKHPYTLLGGILGGMFLSMASHGTDQLIVQRLLSIGDLRKAQRSVILSGFVVFVQMFFFLFIGLELFAFYGTTNIRADEIFVKFITSQMPPYLAGIIIAGVFAAAISTIAGSVNSMASSTVYDIFSSGKFTDKISSNELFFSRLFSVIWALLLMLSAFFFIYTTKSVIEIALGIASFTYSGLLGIFIAGIFQKKINEKDALILFWLTILFMIYIVFFSGIAWTWYVLIGSFFLNLIAIFFAKFKK